MVDETRQKLGKRFMGVFRRGPKTLAEQVEAEIVEQIDRILEECSERTIYSQQNNLDAVNLAYDFNPIHRDKKEALAFPFVKFTDTPVAGVMQAWTGARITNTAVARLNAVEALKDYWGAEEYGMRVIGQEISFHSPIYPEQELSWEFSGAEEKGGNIELTLTGKTKKEKVVDLTTRLGANPSPLPNIAGPVVSKSYELNESDVETFYRIINGDTTNKRVPAILIASLVPSALLAVLKERTGKLEGANMRMNIEYLAEPSTGITQVDVFSPTRIPRPDARQIYRFRAITSQSTRPVSYIEAMCATSSQIDLSPRIEKRIIQPSSQLST